MLLLGLLLSGIPGRDDECRHRAGQIYRQFGVPGVRSDEALSVPMRITKRIPQRGEIADNRLTIAQNTLENPFTVLARRQVQAFRSLVVELGQIIILTIDEPGPVNDMLERPSLIGSWRP